MRKAYLTAALLLVSAGGSTLIAQSAPPPAGTPGAHDTARVTGGTYTADPNHTQVLFGFNHMGFSNNMGIFAQATGTLTLDPKAPDQAKVDITLPINSVATGVPKFNEHLLSADFFDAAKFPTATFTSTSVKADLEDGEAEITGNLTIKGVTKEVTLDAEFTGAGIQPMSKKETVGFSAQTIVKRSDFGLGKYVPLVGDTIELKITAAFEK